jgi:hypothetical protein
MREPRKERGKVFPLPRVFLMEKEKERGFVSAKKEGWQGVAYPHAPILLIKRAKITKEKLGICVSLRVL